MEQQHQPHKRSPLTVTTAPPTNPLNIPEILRRIGEFLPLWTYDSSKTTTSTVPSISPFQRPTQWGRVDPRWRSQLTFTPQTLLACIIVSKLWYKALLPVLWFTFDCETMAMPVPGSDFFERCSDLFRIYRWHGVVQDTLRCTQLTELTFSLSDSGKIGRAQKRVVRRNPHLVSLEWFGLPTVMIDPENFRGLQRLQHLKLYDWVVVDRRLFQVLKYVGRSLRTLELHRVGGLLPGDLLPLAAGAHPPPRRQRGQLVEGNPHRDKDNIHSTVTTTATDHNQPLSLPHLEYLCVNFKQDRPGLAITQALVSCCPKLKHLTIETIGNFDGLPIAQTLRRFCPNLKVLSIGSGIHQQHNAAYLIHHGCSIEGLTAVNATVDFLGDELEEAIMVHASTLTHLKLTWWNSHLDPYKLLNVLVACRHLESLYLSSAGDDTPDKFLEILSNNLTDSTGEGGTATTTTTAGWGGRLKELRLNLPEKTRRVVTALGRMLQLPAEDEIWRPAVGWQLRQPSTSPDRERYLPRAFHLAEALIRYSSVFGLSTLLAKISGQDSDLFAAIAQHAGSLEGLEIIRHMADIGICGVFQVVADCRP
ncbi:hypothetical protein BKA57DRAFT_530468 [Linnemannia elongata]|nr:hypothetical protein BKA57DRAFT_530468 [Linnemannia elongata]